MEQNNHETTRRVRRTFGDSDPALKKIHAETTKDDFGRIDANRVGTAVVDWFRGLVRKLLRRNKKNDRP